MISYINYGDTASNSPGEYVFKMAVNPAGSVIGMKEHCDLVLGVTIIGYPHDGSMPYCATDGPTT